MPKKLLLQYKFKFVLFAFFILLLLSLFLFLIKKSFSSYVSDSDMLLNIEKALYILEEGELEFNIDVDGIIPNDAPYVYNFSISNFNDNDRSDVDITYDISLVSTTNLPLRFELYRNENYSDEDATNIISTNELVNDVDGSWYRYMKVDESYNFYYETDTTDTYTLLIYFPKSYASSTVYEGVMDNIEININSKQIVD